MGLGLLYPYGVILQALALIHFIRRRPDTYWLFIIIFLGPLGAVKKSRWRSFPTSVYCANRSTSIRAEKRSANSKHWYWKLPQQEITKNSESCTSRNATTLGLVSVTTKRSDRAPICRTHSFDEASRKLSWEILRRRFLIWNTSCHATQNTIPTELQDCSLMRMPTQANRKTQK